MEQDYARGPVVIIPGIGGHPEFHRRLVDGLRATRDVHTAPHLDFASEPCPEWSRHVGRWARIVDDVHAGSGRPVDVVGISFGAHVAVALSRARPAAIASTTLISYRPLPAAERRLLRLVRRIPRPAAYVAGTVLFRLSELHSRDRAALRRSRERLYDDTRLVHARLLARLTALADAPPPPNGRSPAPALVTGDRERTLLRRQRRAGLVSEVVPGDHGISLRDTPALLRAVERAAGQGRPTTPTERRT